MKAQTSSQTKRKRTNLVNASRKDCGAYYTLYLTCLVHDEDEFQKYLRMKPQTFKYIYCKVKAKLKKNWCNVHKRAVFEEEQLVITLRYISFIYIYFIKILLRILLRYSISYNHK